MHSLEPLAHRVPNPQGSAPDTQPTEDEMLVAELLGGVAWGTVVRTVIAPRIADIRKRLLLDFELSEVERVRVQAVLSEYRTLLERLYERTEAGELPGYMEKYFL